MPSTTIARTGTVTVPLSRVPVSTAANSAGDPSACNTARLTVTVPVTGSDSLLTPLYAAQYSAAGPTANEPVRQP